MPTYLLVRSVPRPRSGGDWAVEDVEVVMVRHLGLELQTIHRFYFTITEKAPTTYQGVNARFV